jgi:small subunit ribosomal protein S14
MARKGMVENNLKRKRLSEKYRAKREELLKIARDRNAKPEEIFEANMALAKLPRNANPTRFRNRCQLTGRPRGYFRKFKLSRIALRDFASKGMLPGVKKSSW